MFRIQQTVGTVLCCKCGILMAPNASNMFVKCLRSEVDITEGLQKSVIIMYCPECNSYLQPPRTWIKCEIESKELLTFCVKRLKNLNKVRLIHAEFIWTEPHSKRIEVKVRVQKEVLNGVVLEQDYLVEYVVQDHLCESYNMSHRRTFFYLEQLILKHDAALRAIKIKQMDHGIDFFFGNRSHDLKFVDFVGKLVSHDEKSSIYNYKYKFSVVICPNCREDLICLPPKTALSLSNQVPAALLYPLTLRMSYMVADQYWRMPFKALLSSRRLVEYIVLDMEPMISEVNVGRTTYALADVQVARVSDFGKNDLIFNALPLHNNYALGYDLYGANGNDIEIDKYKGLVIPDAILIKKSYKEKRLQKHDKPRAWKLKSMNMEVDNSNRKLDEEKMRKEEEEFLKDVEENPEMALNISLYRNKEYQPSVMTDADDDGPLPLDQMLAGLELEYQPSEMTDTDDDGPLPLHQMLAGLELGDEEEDDNNGQGMGE
ncbi:hypothetical protein MKX01_032498 [Papaver californicum]|nr:hypothetical protein MKX01_032498 [Papaver californicum]